MDVLPGEKITRFIRYSDHFDEPNTVRHEAFLPHKKKVDISVFRISALPDRDALLCNEIWKIAQEHVRKKSKLPIYARADLLVSSVCESDLEVIPDTQSHIRHANIAGFPAEREENKTEDRRIRRKIARQLALASELVMPPESLIPVLSAIESRS